MSARAIARAGLLDVLDRPLAITLEILWRWLAGSLCLIFTAVAFVQAFASTDISDADQHAIFLSRDPQRALISVARILAVLGPKLLAAVAWLLPLCSLLYAIISIFGRALALAALSAPRSPDTHPLFFRHYLRPVAALQMLRVVFFWISVALSYSAILFAARLFPPDFAEMDTVSRYYAALLPLWLLIGLCWFVANYALSIAPATLLRSSPASTLRPLRTFARSWNSEWLRITWHFATLKTLAAIIAFVLSFIVAGWAVLLSWTVSAILIGLISLLYFTVADTLFLARLSAFSRIGVPALHAHEVFIRDI